MPSLIRLVGGPFDGQLVEPTPTRKDASIPDHLAFGRDGGTVTIVGKSIKESFESPDAWQMINPHVPAELEQEPDRLYWANYRRTDRTTPAGEVVFEFFDHPDASP